MAAIRYVLRGLLWVQNRQMIQNKEDMVNIKRENKGGERESGQ